MSLIGQKTDKVDYWKTSNQKQRWVATSLLYIEGRLNKACGYQHLGKLRVRHIEKIERYWNLCLIAWTLTYWIKQNAYLNKILETKPITVNEFKQTINSLLELSSLSTLSKNKKLADD